jgi:hypothetical protein|tara:strand:+ start:203 stop:460 length:258 start_codon:yes stop_codon:yes gene_type:complete
MGRPNKHFAQKWTNPRTTRHQKREDKEDKKKRRKFFDKSTSKPEEFVATRKVFWGSKIDFILFSSHTHATHYSLLLKYIHTQNNA